MKVKVGQLRPSQLVSQWGPGSLVDSPTMSVVVAGSDEWSSRTSKRLDEPRLAAQLQVDGFRRPPWYSRGEDIGGVPSRVFPGFLVCPRCNRLDRYERFEFDEIGRQFRCKNPECSGAGKAIAYPARYVVACPNGHLDDFPWHAYIHPAEVACDRELRLEDSGQTGAITDIWVKCKTHGVQRNLGQAFGQAARSKLPDCSGRRPWLADRDPVPCSEKPHVVLRGASNVYFPVIESAISIPPWSDPIQSAIGEQFELLAKIDTLQKLTAALELINVPELQQFHVEQIWDALTKRRSGVQASRTSLRCEEWQAFKTRAIKNDVTSQFRSRAVSNPEGLEGIVKSVVLIERLREVRALRGFTRIDAITDVGDLDDVQSVDAKLAPLSREKLRWLPGVELRGEGIVIELEEQRIREWERRPAVQDLAMRNAAAEQAWRSARGLEEGRTTPMRYILLHTLSHLLIRQLSLDCGYSSASLRERIYCSTDDSTQMAGILIYTATSDSDGSLGGLVEMGIPERLGPVLIEALEGARLCANDPLCADRDVAGTAAHLNGAACHACLLVSETSCERSNHYLDRSVLVETIRHAGSHFLAT